MGRLSCRVDVLPDSEPTKLSIPPICLRSTLESRRFWAPALLLPRPLPTLWTSKLRRRSVSRAQARCGRSRAFWLGRLPETGIMTAASARNGGWRPSPTHPGALPMGQRDRVVRGGPSLAARKLLLVLAAPAGKEPSSMPSSSSTPATGSPRALLKVADVARILNLHPRSIRRMIADGRLPVVRFGSAIRVRPEVVDELIVNGGQMVTQHD
jgi:excisionase family DNA binding protein